MPYCRPEQPPVSMKSRRRSGRRIGAGLHRPYLVGRPGRELDHAVRLAPGIPLSNGGPECKGAHAAEIGPKYWNVHLQGPWPDVSIYEQCPSISQILNEINYEMVRKLAEGGMGVVYEAHQHGAGQFRKTVAVKLIREEYSSIPEFQKNFIGEARLVADLIHTNIVQTYHLGQIRGQYFMVMEYVGGQNIEQFMDKHRQLGKQVPIDLAAFIVSRVARGSPTPTRSATGAATTSTSSTGTSARRTCSSATRAT
jgi:hypothetical protein